MALKSKLQGNLVTIGNISCLVDYRIVCDTDSIDSTNSKTKHFSYQIYISYHDDKGQLKYKSIEQFASKFLHSTFFTSFLRSIQPTEYGDKYQQWISCMNTMSSCQEPFQCKLKVLITSDKENPLNNKKKP